MRRISAVLTAAMLLTALGYTAAFATITPATDGFPAGPGQVNTCPDDTDGWSPHHGSEDATGLWGSIDGTASGGDFTVEATVNAGYEVTVCVFKAASREFIELTSGEDQAVTHSDGDAVSHWSFKVTAEPTDVTSPPVDDACDSINRPAGMSIDEWLDVLEAESAGEFNRADCFTVVPTLQCGSFDAALTDQPEIAGDYKFVYVLGADQATSLTWLELPAVFGEDHNGGSVDITVYIVGPEADYLAGSGLPNYWENNGRTVTIDTDCDSPAPENVQTFTVGVAASIVCATDPTTGLSSATIEVTMSPDGFAVVTLGTVEMSASGAIEGLADSSNYTLSVTPDPGYALTTSTPIELSVGECPDGEVLGAEVTADSNDEVLGVTVTTVPEVSAETLPFTGSESGDMIKLAILSLLAGALMLFAVRGPQEAGRHIRQDGGWSSQ